MNEKMKEALDKALLALENIEYSEGFGDAEGLADFESVQIDMNMGTIRSVISAISAIKALSHE